MFIQRLFSVLPGLVLWILPVMTAATAEAFPPLQLARQSFLLLARFAHMNLRRLEWMLSRQECP